ncbi:MAG: hypothetical protein HFH85_21140 [Lachnospiraceae bacterium]|jgi:3-oxoacyl-[acyl-carrier-protein] synthase-1|nr:hypothetical protein [Lachnospiraceae bacterium]
MGCLCVGIGIVLDKIRNFSEYESWLIGQEAVARKCDDKKAISSDIKYYIECAFLEAIADAGLNVEKLRQDEHIGVVIGSSLGFIDQIGYGQDCLMDFSWFSKRIRLKGPLYITSNTCTSSLNAVSIAQNLLENGKLDYCIVGGVDVAGDFILNGFESMNLLTSNTHINLQDKAHSGTILSSAIVFLVFKRGSDISKYNVEIATSVVANEAFDLARIEHTGETLQKAIQECFVRTSVSSEQIDILFTCANGIRAMDLQQKYLIENRFNSKICTVSSVKIVVGHTLGASTLLDIISAIVFVKNGKVLKQDGEWVEKQAKYILILSIGFVGAVGAVLLRNNMEKR